MKARGGRRGRPEGGGMERPKEKILFVIISLVGGGAEKILVRLVNHLDKTRYEVRLALFEEKMDYLRELDPAVQVLCFGKTSRWEFPKIIFRLAGVMRSFQPDVVISLLDYANVVSVLARKLARVRTRLLLCEHSYPLKPEPLYTFRGHMPWLIRATYHSADRIVVVSRSIREYLLRRVGLPAERVQVIYNPIPLAEVVASSREKVRHPFLGKKDLKVIMSVGRLETVKRYDRLLKAFARAHRRDPNLRLILLGKGTLEGALKKLASDLGIGKTVSFAGFKSNPYAWIARADVFALSSEREGFPNVLIEAMACGVPVVSVDCLSGPSEIITHGQNGFLLPEEDEPGLADALVRLATDVRLRSKFSRAGKAFAARFSAERIVPQYESLFAGDRR